MGLLLVVLTLCAHWNKFRQFIYIWWAYIWEEGLIFGMLIGLHIWGRHTFGGGGEGSLYTGSSILHGFYGIGIFKMKLTNLLETNNSS